MLRSRHGPKHELVKQRNRKSDIAMRRAVDHALFDQLGAHRTEAGNFNTQSVGNIPGSIGEVSKVLLLLGAIFLFYRRIISWHIPITFILTVAVLSVFFRQDPVFQVLSGGVVLGAFFMATDYVTSPLFSKGKIILGGGCGLLTVLIRNLGAYPEGVCYAILIMNILVPLIDKFTKPRVFGTKI